ncbi:MAG: [FeFe] hydrogenase H-cluster radical SAM maturase HydG [bacterium]|nr:[FeFe] hydrogenase H-cluster radical SAM maturase HydG [bacterium]
MYAKKEFSKVSQDFIDDDKIEQLINKTGADISEVRDIIAKSLEKKSLSVEECAVLLSVEDIDVVEEIFDAARQLKRDVYGNRIVIFAPLYIGNHCINDCKYCGFRKSLRTAVRKTLTDVEIHSEVTSLENEGHKRLILVFGEHPKYSPEYIADTVRSVYKIKNGNGEIRRVNINAAPMNHEGFKVIKESGIGTYQIFQETYHHKTYEQMHPSQTCKGDYLYRLDGLNRAFDVGCDDMGIGALFGLYKWKFEVLSLITHSLFLQDKFGVGPHTISFPRLREAHGIKLDKKHIVSDFEFKRLVAILRLAVPYTGLILTARETPEIRRELMGFGVSQIDAGSCIDLGGYSNRSSNVKIGENQFSLGDMRPMDEIVNELLHNNYIPSFCTSCYRIGRTGERFMEFAVPGFIEKYCTPNALITLKEYLLDYASKETEKIGGKLIKNELDKVKDLQLRKNIFEKLQSMNFDNTRDIYY